MISEETRSKIAESTARLQAAEEELKLAKNAHRESFRQALVDLFNGYGLQLDASGCEGCSLEINELGPHSRKPRIEDIPE